jgi:hypothetical protein
VTEAPDVSLIRAHVEIINKLAAPLAGQGKLVIACFGEDPDQPHRGRANPAGRCHRLLFTPRSVMSRRRSN